MKKAKLDLTKINLAAILSNSDRFMKQHRFCIQAPTVAPPKRIFIKESLFISR
jgi:hypothetical protein